MCHSERSEESRPINDKKIGSCHSEQSEESLNLAIQQ